MRMTRYIYPCLTLALFAVLICFQCYKAFHMVLVFDDAYFAAVAKNIAGGKGYSAVYFDRLYPFHWSISTGPVILLPAAMMVALFGNTYWAAQFSCVLVIDVLLICAFYRLKTMASANSWPCAAFFLFSVMLLSNHQIGDAEPMLIWHTLLGEVPSALCLIIGALTLAADRINTKNVFYSGLIAGIGVLCKLLVLIGSASLGLILIISYCADNLITKRLKISNLIVYGLGVIMPLLTFEIFKWLWLGNADYLLLVQSLARWIQNYNNPASSAPWFFGKLTIVGQYFGVMADPPHAPNRVQIACLILLGLGLPCAAIYLAIRAARERLSATWFAATALFCAGSLHMLWFLCINVTTMPRYMSQSIVYLCAAIALILGDTTYKNARIIVGLALGLVILRYDAALYVWKGMQQDPYVSEERQIAQRIIEVKKAMPDSVLFSCGNALEVEYLLPGTGNFVNCRSMFDPAFSVKRHILLTDRIHAKGEQLYFLPDTSIVKNVLTPDAIATACPDSTLFSGARYSLTICK